MNKNDNSFNDFSVISLNELSSNKISRDFVFYVLLGNTIITLIVLTLILNPPITIRNLYLKFIQYSIFKIKIYHSLILIIGFYSYLYFYFKNILEQIDTDNYNYVHERLVKFHRVFELESKIWMLFIIIICLLSIYRHLYLIKKEEEMKNSI